MREIASPPSGRINFVAAVVEDSLNLSGVLVRPDGVVAWASDGAADEAGLAAAVSRWFG